MGDFLEWECLKLNKKRLGIIKNMGGAKPKAFVTQEKTQTGESKSY